MGRRTLNTHDELQSAIQYLMEGHSVQLSPKKQYTEEMLATANDAYNESKDVKVASRKIAEQYGVTEAYAQKVVYESLTVAPEPTVEHRNYFAWEILHTINRMIDVLVERGNPKETGEITKLLYLKKETIRDLFGKSTKIDWSKQQTFVPVVGFFPEELKSGVTTDPEELDQIFKELTSVKREKAYNKNAEDTNYEEVNDAD